MTRFAIAAFVVATLSGSAFADTSRPPRHAAGDPVRSGKFCWTETNSSAGYGYWARCGGSGIEVTPAADKGKGPTTAIALTHVSPAIAARNAQDAAGNSGGGDGGGGGGGGGK